MDHLTQTLQMAVDWEVHSGSEVVYFSPYEAVLRRRAKPMSGASHVLHLLLTLLTMGVWAIVWFCLANFKGAPQVYGIGVDRFGALYGFDPAQRPQLV